MFPESSRTYAHGYAVVAIDVIRATTSAVTVVANGGRCFPVPSVETAHRLATRLLNPLLVGEIGGEIPPRFHMNNSPAQLARLPDVTRPVILLSSSGTRLLHETRNCDATYLACLRNWSHTARYLARHHGCVALIGAGTRGQPREEDQLCCAWIAGALLAAGFAAGNNRTEAVVKDWVARGSEAILKSKSVQYLKNTGQLQDLDFILSHIDDIPKAFVQEEGEVLMASPKQPRSIAPARDARATSVVRSEIC